ncbi:SDR family NAD(P)-dependent oxidoreductase [Chloroflexota bacterium]
MGKVVIITGAAGQLGSQVARRFGAAGAKVVISDITEAQEGAEKLASEINKGGGQCFACKADVRSNEELNRMVVETVRRWDRIDIVVNAAGGSLAALAEGKNKLLLEYTDEEWDIVVDTNLKGTFNCLRAVAPQMIKQREGHIILISSGQGIRPGPLVSIYAAAKAGVFGLMKAAARELGDYNIKVNAVNPGLIPRKSFTSAGFPSDFIASYAKETALGRLSTPEDFADFVFYLSQTKNISGQTFNVDSRILF